MVADSFDARALLKVGGREYEIFRLAALADRFDVATLPFSLKVLLENLLRVDALAEGSGGSRTVRAGDIEALASWDPSAEQNREGGARPKPGDTRLRRESPFRPAGPGGPAGPPSRREIAFTPARVLMQDLTGVPAVVDLAAMRDAMAQMGGDPARINPLAPAELVIDHSVQVDAFGTRDAFRVNAERELERNRERYLFLRWGQQAFDNLKVVPPDTGIVHQVNLEYLARVVFVEDGRVGSAGAIRGAAEGAGARTEDAPPRAYPDTLVGTDSHTTMVNGLGVLGWGVGGIEAEAAMLGQPLSMLIPQVVGFRLRGALREGATATDLVLTVTELLREHGVVGKFVEFHGAGLAGLPLADRATIGNMSPEFGSTCAIFPIDAETLRYLELSGRPREQVGLVEAYAREQLLWHDERSPAPRFSEELELDLGAVVPSLAGPKRPQDRISLTDARPAFRRALAGYVPSADGEDEAVAATFPASDPTAAQEPAANGEGPRVASAAAAAAVAAVDADAELDREEGTGGVAVTLDDGTATTLRHGHVVIAAITSCTNTSNPSVMIGAGILARNALARGLTRKPWVKTSLAPGSKVVSEYLDRAGLTAPLEELGFNLVGYGCTTCIGNSGPLPEEISKAVAEEDLAVVSVLSGNRNFEGRINPDVKMNYLASPPLCVAYALAGTMDIDIVADPLGRDGEGNEVYLRDIWPSGTEIAQTIERAVRSDMFHKSYAEVFTGDERWNALDVPVGERFAWVEDSTYVRLPPFFAGMPREPEPIEDVRGARVLALLGDSVTTDHISPAGSIKRDGPAGRYLQEHGVAPRDFNSYGARRGNHEVMMRGTFANIRIRNRLRTPGGAALPEGGVTYHLPMPAASSQGGPRAAAGAGAGGQGPAEQLPIYDAAMRYQQEEVPLVVIAGKEYGTGSSRDWAAKGTKLLGVRAVIAQSFERIHRSNLIGMGVLPLQFKDGQSADSLGLTGQETFSIEGIAELPRELTVRADDKQLEVTVRIDTPREADYFRHGGILQYVLRGLLAA
ncbi:MAG TPA: aconitate hydratase [Solirubrobacteraceae bacterium]|jgi:aconitate hydratase|nr:aconitate hydratase [Solirubrobacteraceae bacterium]